MEYKENKDINSNFHRIGGKDLYKDKNEKFLDYRKKWNEYPRDFHVGNFPLFLDIESTNVCNLRCPFCATTMSGKKQKKGYMSVSMMEKIIDEGADNGLYGVKFNIRGEPLLHPKIDYFVKYAKEKGLIDVYFNTNGFYLTKEMSYKLIDARLDRISISFEGYTKEVYEKNRVGSSYEKVLENINNLREIRDKNKIDYPKIRIQTVKLPNSEFDMEEYKNFWKSRVDEIAFLDYKDMDGKKKGIKNSWICYQLWQRMAILWNGSISPCNHDDELKIFLGNINDNLLKTCWESDKLNKIRDIHKKGLAYKIKACDGCYLRSSEICKHM